MHVACRNAHWGARPLHAGLSLALVSGLAERGEDWHRRPLLVLDEMGESVWRVGLSARCAVAHVGVVVKVLGFCDPLRDDGSRVGGPV